jgi:hypothetical protein
MIPSACASEDKNGPLKSAIRELAFYAIHGRATPESVLHTNIRFVPPAGKKISALPP